MASSAIPPSLRPRSWEAEDESETVASCRPGAVHRSRVSIPSALLFYPDRDFTTLEIRVWSLLECGDVSEVKTIAERLGAHRVSVSRALSNLVAHGFASRKNVQYRNPRTGTYEILVYVALEGQPSPTEALEDVS